MAEQNNAETNIAAHQADSNIAAHHADNNIAAQHADNNVAAQHADELAAKIIAKCYGREGGILSNPMDLISSGMELVRDISAINGADRKRCVIHALEIVARGKDGVAGTADDLIAPENLKMLSVMLEHNIVEHVVEALLDAAKGRLNIVAIKDVVIDTAEVSISCYNWCQSKTAKH